MPDSPCSCFPGLTEPTRDAELGGENLYMQTLRCLPVVMVQMKDLERLLSEADRERREVREKYVALGRRVDTLQGSEEALRYGIQVRKSECWAALQAPSCCDRWLMSSSDAASALSCLFRAQWQLPAMTML